MAEQRKSVLSTAKGGVLIADLLTDPKQPDWLKRAARVLQATPLTAMAFELLATGSPKTYERSRSALRGKRPSLEQALTQYMEEREL